MMESTDEQKIAMTNLIARLDGICKERNVAEQNRVFEEYKRDYPSLTNVFPLRGSGEDRSMFFMTMKNVQLILSGSSSLFNRGSSPKQVRRELIDLLSCPFTYKRRFWQIRFPVNPQLVDDGNLIEGEADQPVVEQEDLSKARELIADVMEMIGRLARQIYSCESQRILRCRVALDGRLWFNENLLRPEAEKLVDEIIYCFKAIKIEIDTLSPAERVRLVRPKMPRHRPDIIYHPEPPDDLPPEECTKLSRDAALKRLRDEYFMLLPHMWFNCEWLDPVKETDEAVQFIADELKEGRPTYDHGQQGFDYKRLGDVLSADFRLYYDRYFMDDDYMEDGTHVTFRSYDGFIEETDQQKAKQRIVKNLENILNKSVALAAECRSKTLDDWSNLTALFTKRGGDFHSYDAIDDDQAAVDLWEFLDGFSRARQRLSVDWFTHNRTDVNEGAVPTCPQGPVIEKITKSVGKIKEASENILHYESDGEVGIKPTDGRRKALIRGQMTDKGTELVRDKGHTGPQAAKEIIRQAGDQPFAYGADEEGALTRAISRQCDEDGIRLPNKRT